MERGTGFGGVPLGFAIDGPRGSAGRFTGVRAYAVPFLQLDIEQRG